MTRYAGRRAARQQTGRLGAHRSVRLVIHFAPALAARLAVASVMVALAAAVLPAWRIARLDPASVFRA